ncbi:MAG: hypothetical protein AAF393_04395 [Pseudomonadota bacterium]
MEEQTPATNGLWFNIVRAIQIASASELGILALCAVIIGLAGVTMFWRDQNQYIRLAAFAMIVGSVLMIAIILPDRPIEGGEGSGKKTSIDGAAQTNTKKGTAETTSGAPQEEACDEFDLVCASENLTVEDVRSQP